MKINYKMLALIALMALTRIHHFGSTSLLPDASLAVFFLAGLWNSNRLLLAGLLVEAAALDYLAINQFDVSDWCLSPAYVFLIPTYAVLWLAGRYRATFSVSATAQNLLKTLASATLAVTAAFVISNASFYLFSGRYAELSAIGYIEAVKQYYLPYLSVALLYTVLALALNNVYKLVADFSSKDHKISQ